MKIIFDASSLLWTCLLTGKDPEGHKVETPEGKESWCNTAAYAYEFAVNSVVATLDRFGCTPIDAVFAVEGLNSKARRLMIYREYKAGRGKHHNDVYAQFAELRTVVLETFRQLGATVVTQDNAEGDDLVAFLALNSEEDVVVRSNDQDLASLNGLNPQGKSIHTYIGDRYNENPYGAFPMQYVSLYKAMVGDTGDNIKGIVGFGKSAWEKFDLAFGDAGMAEMVRLAGIGSLQELEAEAAQNKLVKQIYEGRADFLRSYKLASLHPEWCDTLDEPLQWRGGIVLSNTKDERLQKWTSKRTLVTAANYDKFFERFQQRIRERDWVTLDIETSTPDESDEWLAAQGDPEGVDVIGSELTGLSLTFGSNMQYTVYISVDHKDTDNVPKDRIKELLDFIESTGTEIVIHNTQFEGTVLYNEFGEQRKENGNRGLLKNWIDTRFEASYVDEDSSKGLKKLSSRWLGYDQVDYKTTVTVDGVMYKMRELPATHVFSYATDDTINTAGVHVLFKYIMQLEHQYEIHRQVEIDASYLHCWAYIKGTKADLSKLAELKAEDEAEAAKARAVIDSYLIANGWEGTVLPVFAEIDAPALKLAYYLHTGDEFKTQVRTPAKVLALMDNPLLSAAASNIKDFNAFIATHWKAAPVFNPGSPKQMQRLMYETMGLPQKVFNKPTDAMKAQGLRQGSVKTDALAITYALLDATEEQKAVLQALKVLTLVSTRFKLFYNPLPYFVHWKTGRVHSSHNQCGTNTRRASSSKPNLQQLSKHEKVEGYSPRVRELYIPHKKNAVIVSFDFKSQELVLMAHWSRDATLMACFVGSNLIDMHSMTGVGVYNTMNGKAMTYVEYLEVLKDETHPEYKKCKKARALGKAVNFGSQYRIAAPKLSTMLLVTEDEAQAMLDAKAAAFPDVEAWSQKEMAEVQKTGKTYTVMGAVRHLRSALKSEDRYVSSKAPRQALSFRIQGSAAEQTKLAEGRMWASDVLDRFDCEYFGAVHDECVWSVAIEDLHEFIGVVYALMTAPYSTMSMPVGSSVSVGPDFGQQTELEGDFSLEHVNEVLNAIFGKATA